MITVVLCSTSPRFASSSIMGKAVWERARDATRGLRPQGAFWLGAAPPSGIRSVSPRKIKTLGGTILVLPAELACIGTRSLRRLVQANRRGPSAIFAADGGAPVALAASAAEIAGRTLSVSALAKRLEPRPVFLADEDELLLVDSARAWARAHQILRRRKVEALARRGVLLPDPTSVLVDPDVSVGRGAMLAPWVVIEGSSRIGAGCVVGSFSHVVDSHIGAGTTVLDHCFIRESRIGRDASVGPYAHLRPESDVGQRARVGNFVELKKSKVGGGAKVPHLSYVGDATIGRDANLGAGTITCNYDGKSKNRTVVGDGAFIGSDVQLVAPVRVGKGAFVAAGSCIVRNVPAGALALARSHQVIKKGWARKRNSRS